MNLELDGLVAGGAFDGRPPVIDGVQWVLTDLTGWWGAPQTRTTRTDRSNAPGAHRGPAYADIRTIEATITATAVNCDPRLMRLAERQAAGLCADPDRLYQLAVTDDAGTLACYVERDGDIVPTPRDRLAYSSIFSIPLAAPDPRRVDPNWTSVRTPIGVSGSGGVVVVGSTGVRSAAPGVNAGTAPVPVAVAVSGEGTADEVPLVLQIDGGADDAVVVASNGASIVTYRGRLDATVWINCNDQPAHDVPGAPDVLPAHGALLTGGGNARSGVGVRGDWPRLRPGQVMTFALGGQLDVDAALTVHTRAAFT